MQFTKGSQMEICFSISLSKLMNKKKPYFFIVVVV